MTPALIQTAKAQLEASKETATLAQYVVRARRNPRYGSVLLYDAEGTHIVTMVDGTVIWRGHRLVCGVR
ncbi:MAG: hypothetical protein ACO3LT_06850 [Ilumatobacteraceae bacterium]